MGHGPFSNPQSTNSSNVLEVGRVAIAQICNRGALNWGTAQQQLVLAKGNRKDSDGGENDVAHHCEKGDVLRHAAVGATADLGCSNCITELDIVLTTFNSILLSPMQLTMWQMYSSLAINSIQ